MALEDQPPWRKGNPERIRLLQLRKVEGYQYATTFQRRGAKVVMSTWSRPADGDGDFVWDLNDTIGTTVGVLRKILRAAG